MLCHRNKYLSNVGQLFLHCLPVLDLPKISDFPRPYSPPELLVRLLEHIGSGTNTVAITIIAGHGQTASCFYSNRGFDLNYLLEAMCLTYYRSSFLSSTVFGMFFRPGTYTNHLLSSFSFVTIGRELLLPTAPLSSWLKPILRPPTQTYRHNESRTSDVLV